MFVSKGIVNSAMITFFELTDQMTRSGRWRVDVISVGKASCRSTSAITIKQCWFVPIISMWSFRNVSFFNKLYTCLYTWNFIGSFTTHFCNFSINPFLYVSTCNFLGNTDIQLECVWDLQSSHMLCKGWMYLTPRVLNLLVLVIYHKLPLWGNLIV